MLPIKGQRLRTGREALKMNLGAFLKGALTRATAGRAWHCALCHSTGEIVEISRKTRDPSKRRVLALAAVLWGDNAAAMQLARDYGIPRPWFEGFAEDTSIGDRVRGLLSQWKW